METAQTQFRIDPSGRIRRAVRLVIKASQLSLFGAPAAVKEPGKRGGKFYRTPNGQVRYGQAPQSGGVAAMYADMLADDEHLQRTGRERTPARDIAGNKLSAAVRRKADTIQAAADAARAGGVHSEAHKHFMAGRYDEAIEAGKRASASRGQGDSN